WYRKNFTILKSRKNYHGLHGIHFFYFTYLLQHQFLIGCNIFGNYFEDKIPRTCNVVTFDNFLDLVDFLHESIDMAFIVTYEPYQYKSTYSQPDFFRVKLGMVTFNYS